MKQIIALTGIALLAGCITITPGRYSTLVDNQQALKKYAGSNSGNGKSIKVANRYEFESSLDPHVACDRTARALTPAVQDLIKKAVTDPQFGALLR